MADLITHACSALIPGAFVRSRLLGPVVIGAVLPDLVSRFPATVLDMLREGGLSIPGWLLMPWGVLNEPIALVLVFLLLAQAFRPIDRWVVFRGLLVGCVLHVGLDVLQDHHGDGYQLLFPLSHARFELGWIDSEATVSWAPWLALITAGLWAARWARSRQRA